MDTMAAFAMGQAARAANKPQMVFDWDKAAARIRDEKPTVAAAGLRGDWGYTGGTIYEDGKPDTTHYTYLSSNWAVPELELDGVREPCWRLEDDSPGWGAATKWPESALAILNASVGN